MRRRERSPDPAGNVAAGNDAAGNDAAGNDAAGNEAAGNEVATGHSLDIGSYPGRKHAGNTCHGEQVRLPSGCGRVEPSMHFAGSAHRPEGRALRSEPCRKHLDNLSIQDRQLRIVMLDSK
jgi:hypothetical protein